MTLSNKSTIAIISGIALVILIFIVLGLVSTKIINSSPNKLTVGATIFPVADIARQVGGDDIDVVLILNAGASPHTFELTPKKATKLANVKLIFAIGQGIDEWASGTASISGADVVELDKNVELNCDTECDPHYWLTFDNAIVMARSIADKFIAMDPDNEEAYYNRMNEYITKLETAQRESRKIVKNAPKNLVIFHDSWDYFADSLDLNIVGTFEPEPGREPTPRQLAELQKTVKEYSITSIYREPQLSISALLPFTKDLNLKILTLDPLGGTDDRDSYIKTMLFNAHAIASQ